jgi:hypothetical protein
MSSIAHSTHQLLAKVLQEDVDATVQELEDKER